MTLKKITIQNFLSIRSIVLSLQDRGLTLLKGVNKDNDCLNNNGAGKSSIIEAIVYALYGRTLRGLKGDAVVHRIPGKNMKIFLDLTDDDGTEYRIARYRKHSVNKNKSILYRDGKDITPKSESDFNDFIVNLLQADFLTFTSSLLYSVESFKFTSATDSEMKSTFDTMLGLDIYQKCFETVKLKLKTLNLRLTDIEWKISDRNSKVEDLQKRIQETEKSCQDYENNLSLKRDELSKKIQSTESEVSAESTSLDNLADELLDLQDQKDSLKKSLDKLQSQLLEVEKLKDEIQSIKDEKHEHESTIKRQQRFIAEFTEQNQDNAKEIAHLHNKMSKLSQQKSELSNKIGSPCPTCGSPLTLESLEPAKQEIDEQVQILQNKSDKIQGKIERANTDILSAQSQIQDAQSQIQELETTLDEFQGLLEKSKNLIDEKAELQKSLQKAQEDYFQKKSDIKVKSATIQQLKDTVSELQDELAHLDGVNPYDEILNKYKAELKTAQDEIQDFQKSISDLSEEKSCLEFWQKAYSNQGIKSFILDDITPFLNRRVNKYLSKLSSGHIEVKFNTQTTLKTGETREKFSIEINNQDGGQEYSANSGGERKRIDLAINLALQDLVASRSNKRINIAIWDEVFDALDQTGIEKVIELLQELSSEKSTILVVSHNQHLQSYFTNTITVVKENGFSTLLEDSENSEDEQAD